MKFGIDVCSTLKLFGIENGQCLDVSKSAVM